MCVYFTGSLGASFQIELPLVQLAQIYRDLSEREKIKKEITVLGNFKNLAIVLHSSHPDGIRSDGRDGGSIAGAILPLNIDSLTAPEPALLIEQLSIFYPRVTGE